MAANTPEPFSAANMVMVAALPQPLNLPAVFELLTVVEVDFKFGVKNTGSRVKIPYFGIEGPIVSVRFDGKSRGVRKEGGQLRNVAAIDLQYSEKNIHLKVSENKIAVMGALNEGMGLGACHKLLEHLIMVQEHWLHIRTLPAEVRDTTVSWLCKTLQGPEVGVVATPNGDMPVYELKQLSDVKNIGETTPEGVDMRCAMYLAMFAHEYRFYHEYLNKLTTLFALSHPIYGSTRESPSRNFPFYKPPTLGASRIYNGVYNYNVGCEVSLIEVAEGLLKRGYLTSYHNWARAKLLPVVIPLTFPSPLSPDQVVVGGPLTPLVLPSPGSTGSVGSVGSVLSPLLSPPVEMSSEEGDLLDDISADVPRPIEIPNTGRSGKGKQPAHRLTVYQSGSVRQSSPCSQAVAEQIKLRFIRDVLEIVAENRQAQAQVQ